MLAAGGNDDAGGSADPVLAVDGVDVWLGGRRILDTVSFTIRAGQFCGLIGSNGAGKTTLFRVILGLLRPNAGRVLVGCRPPGAGRRSIGYVAQNVVVDADAPLRARDFVALGLDGHRLGFPLPNRGRRRLVDEMLESVDARSFADERMGTLSGGEQQRILVAHALVRRPRLLLMDEPLANLDLRSEHEIVDLLGRICEQQRVAVLISAHDLNPLLPVIERVVYLAGGRVASGATDEVVRSEVLSELYGHPVTVLRVEGRVIVVGGPAAVPPALPTDPTTVSPSAPEGPTADPVSPEAARSEAARSGAARSEAARPPTGPVTARGPT